LPNLIFVYKILFHVVFFLELFNTAACFDKHFLASRVERMALGANFNMNFGLCGACYELIAAVTAHFALMIFRVDSFSHYVSPRFLYTVNLTFKKYITVILI